METTLLELTEVELQVTRQALDISQRKEIGKKKG